jgi:hypothetical protein
MADPLHHRIHTRAPVSNALCHLDGTFDIPQQILCAPAGQSLLLSELAVDPQNARLLNAIHS